MNLLNWIRELYDTYETCKIYVDQHEDCPTLLPVSYTWINAQIDCFLDEKANLYFAKVIDKKHAATMIPCTIKSANRSSGPVAHPLVDKLIYVAKDISDYGIEHSYFDLYYSQLSKWCQQEDTPECLKTVCEYLEKGTLIRDLVEHKILTLDDQGNLLEKWTGSPTDKPLLFKEITKGQESAVIRFTILHDNDRGNEETWRDKKVQNSFLNYYLPTLTEKNLCMITGEYAPITDFHSAYLRFPGDSAKLISSQDNLGFKYTGRNSLASQAVSISYEASQKAHNALKWLIQKQGIKQNGLVILVWGTEKIETERLDVGSFDLFGRLETQLPTTYQNYADALKKMLFGQYAKQLEFPNDNVVIMLMDAATKGRLSILFYQSFHRSQFYESLLRWYRTCCWKRVPYYIKDSETGEYKRRRGLGTPSLRIILETLYGVVDSDDIIKAKKKATTRLISCMIDGTILPKEYVANVFYQFCHFIRLETNIQRDELVSVACALARKYRNDIEQNEEEWTMDVDYSKKQTYYLWGRLLAYAEWIERKANYISKENRETNATRFLKQYQMYPAKTWTRIYMNLTPYFNKLRKNNLQIELDYFEMQTGLIQRYLEEQNVNDSEIDDRFMLGYGAQLGELKERDEENRKNYLAKKAKAEKEEKEKAEGNE